MNILRKIIHAVILRLSSLSAAVSGNAKKYRRQFVKTSAFILALFVFAGSFCGYYVPTVSAADYRNLSFELYPEDGNAEKTVTLNGLMPKDASAEAVDVSGDYTDENGCTDISENTPNASLVAAYDITITDGDSEYQPDADKPVRVEIINPGITENSGFELWHIKDSGEKERIENFTIEDGKISFTAFGFSVYAIVDISEPNSIESISGLDDLEGSRATAGFCLYCSNFKFFTNSVNGNGALVETDDPHSASTWFFTEEGGFYKISTMVDGVEKFIHTRSGDRLYPRMERYRQGIRILRHRPRRKAVSLL